jgi:hypothetical protein
LYLSFDFVHKRYIHGIASAICLEDTWF